MPNALDAMMGDGPKRPRNALDALLEPTPDSLRSTAAADVSRPPPVGADRVSPDPARVAAAASWATTIPEAVFSGIEGVDNVMRYALSHQPWLVPPGANVPSFGDIWRGVAPGSNFRLLNDVLPPSQVAPLPTGRTLNVPTPVVTEAANLATGLTTYMTGGLGSLSKAGRELKSAEYGQAAVLEAVAKASRGADDAAAAGVRALQAARQLQGAQAAINAGASERTLLEIAGVNVVPAPNVVVDAARVLDRWKQSRLGRMFITERQAAPPALEAAAVKAQAAKSVAFHAALRRDTELAGEVTRIARDHGLTPDVGMRAVLEAAEYSKAKNFDRPLDWLDPDELETFFGGAQQITKDELYAAGQMRAEQGLASFLSRREWAEYRGLPRQKATATFNPAARAAELRAIAQARAGAQAVARGIRRAESVFGLPPNVMRELDGPTRQFIAQANATNAAMIDDAARAGVKLSELVDERAYILHAMTEEAQDAMQSWAKQMGGELASAARSMGRREFTEKHGPQIMREFRNMSAEDINKLGRQLDPQTGLNRIPFLGNKTVSDVFISNPFMLQALREGISAKAIASRDLFVGAMAEYGKKLDGLSRAEVAKLRIDGWRAVPNEIEGIGDKYLFPRPVADLLQKHMGGVKNPSAFEAAVGRMNQVWKAYTLGTTPGYHFRNQIGDLWNAVVLGGVNPEWANDAARIVASQSDLLTATLSKSAAGRAANLDRNAVLAVQRGKVRMTLDEWFKIAEANGATNSTLAISDFTGAITEGSKRIGVREAARRGGVKGALKEVDRALTDNAYVRASLAAGNMRENFTRMMTFIDRVDKGDSFEAAAAFVRRHLFDYADITEAERSARNTLFPFLTWTRKNTPLQLSYLFTKPGRFNALQSARRAAAETGNEGYQGNKEAELQPFLKHGMPIAAGRNKEGKPEFIRGRGLIPAGDLTQMSPLGALAWGLENMTPFISAPAEAISGFDLSASTQNFIDTGRFEPQELAQGQASDSRLGLPIPQRALPFFDLLSPAMILDRANPFDMFGDYDKPSAFGVSRGRRNPSPALRYLSPMLGIRPYVSDPEQQQRKQAKDFDTRKARIERLLEDAMRRNSPVQIKEQQAALERLERERSGQ